MNDKKIKKSTFFGLNENIAAALAAGLPLVLTFVPYVGYFAWIVPLIMVIFERRSNFVRLCAGKSVVYTVILLAATALFNLINIFVKGETPVPLFISLCGAVTSIVRVLCAVIMIMTAYDGYMYKDFDSPIVSALVKKTIKYNDK